MKVSTKWI